MYRQFEYIHQHCTVVPVILSHYLPHQPITVTTISDSDSESGTESTSTSTTNNIRPSQSLPVTNNEIIHGASTATLTGDLSQNRLNHTTSSPTVRIGRESPTLTNLRHWKIKVVLLISQAINQIMKFLKRHMTRSNHQWERDLKDLLNQKEKETILKENSQSLLTITETVQRNYQISLPHVGVF